MRNCSTWLPSPERDPKSEFAEPGSPHELSLPVELPTEIVELESHLCQGTDIFNRARGIVVLHESLSELAEQGFESLGQHTSEVRPASGLAGFESLLSRRLALISCPLVLKGPSDSVR